MFRCALWPFSPFPRTSAARTARYFHRVTTDFVAHDVRGNLVTKKVLVIVGNPGETYVLIEPGVGNAFRAAALHTASPSVSASAACADDRCKLTFFHDSQHFGYGKYIRSWGLSSRSNILYSITESASYPRLYVPCQMPTQTASNTSPATLFLVGKMHEIVLDGTPDGTNQAPIHPVA